MTDSDSQREGDDPLEREALDWVRHLLSGEATVADLRAVERWRRRSQSHEAAFLEARRLWDGLAPAGRNVLQRRGELLSSGRRIQPAPRVSRRVFLGGSVAASAAAAYLMVRPPAALWPAVSELAADYRTAPGERREITLAGNIVVDLNTRTSINLQAGPEAERIELVSGETAIATGKNAAGPVTVIAGNGTISAQDATFNVRHDSSRAGCVTCLEGAVQVEHHDVVRLGPGEQVSYAGRGLGPVVAVDPAVTSAWREGVLIFHDTPLAEVVEEVNRYRPGRILLMNEALGRRAINARFRIDDIDEVMVLVERVFGAEVTALPGKIVLLG